MKKLNSLLVKFKIFDADNTLSLTSVCLIVLIVKIATSPLDYATATAFFLALLNYNSKKLLNDKKEVRAFVKSNEIDALEAKIDAHGQTLKAAVNSAALSKTFGK